MSTLLWDEKTGLNTFDCPIAEYFKCEVRGSPCRTCTVKLIENAYGKCRAYSHLFLYGDEETCSVYQPIVTRGVASECLNCHKFRTKYWILIFKLDKYNLMFKVQRGKLILHKFSMEVEHKK